MNAQGSRLLVQAPSGSGKTATCVKLATGFLVAAARKHDAAEQLRRRLQPGDAAVAGFEPGDAVVVSGLETAAGAALNGQEGTVVCVLSSGRLKVRLPDSSAVKSVRPADLQRSTEAPAVSAFLLLTFSPVLAKLAAAELRADLAARCPGAWPAVRSVGDGVFEVSLDGSDDGAVVRVAAVDGFVGSVIRPVDPAAAPDPALPLAPLAGPRRSAAVVDEGHVVSSCQPDPQLHGQHHFADPTKVRAVLERALPPRRPGGGVPRRELPAGRRRRRGGAAPGRLRAGRGVAADCAEPRGGVGRVGAVLQDARRPRPRGGGTGRAAELLPAARRGRARRRWQGRPPRRRAEGEGASRLPIRVPGRREADRGALRSARGRVQGPDPPVRGVGRRRARAASGVLCPARRIRRRPAPPPWATLVAVLVPGSPSTVAAELLAAVAAEAAASSSAAATAGAPGGAADNHGDVHPRAARGGAAGQAGTRPDGTVLWAGRELCRASIRWSW